MSLELAIVMPAYNEEECIEEVVDKWSAMLREKFPASGQAKFIIVNDGSRDSTGEKLDALAKDNDLIELIHQENGGHGKALYTGYGRAIKLKPEWVFQVDSDNQFFPDDFDKLWEKRNTSKFILGFRKKRYDEFNRLIITRILKMINLILFRVFIDDANIPYRLIKGEYLEKLINQLPGEVFAPNIFIAVMAKRDGQKVYSIPVVHKERETGTVSIVSYGLLKACWRSTKELANFSATLGRRVKALNS